jgi:hypothetical protein
MLAMRAAARGQLALVGASAALVLTGACSKPKAVPPAPVADAAVEAGVVNVRTVDASLRDGAASEVASRMNLFRLSSLPVPASKIEVVPDRHPAIVAMPTATLDSSFLLEFAVGGGMDGFTVLSVPASGHCRFVFMREVNRAYVWRVVAFDVSHQDIEQILALLNAEQVMSMAQSYIHPVADGTQWIVHVRTQGCDKYIYASNEFPPALVRLGQYLRDNLIDARPSLFDSSRLLSNGQEYNRHFELSSSRYRGEPKTGYPLFDDPAVIVTTRYVEQRESGNVAVAQPEGSHVEAEIQDWSDNAEKLMPRVTLDKFGYLYYPERKIKPAHRLMLVLTLLKGRTVLATSVPQPVITLDGAHALEVELVLP